MVVGWDRLGVGWGRLRVGWGSDVDPNLGEAHLFMP